MLLNIKQCYLSISQKVHGYENTPEDARRMSLDATAMINPMPDFINAYDHAEQGKYTDAALYAGFGIFPFSAGPLVRGTKEILMKGKKAALESFTHLTNLNLQLHLYLNK